MVALNFAARRPTPADQTQQNIRELMKQRQWLQHKLLQLMAKHQAVFDELNSIKGDIQDVETQVKDAVRAMYKEGAARGIFNVYEDDIFGVKVAVKYGRDAINPAELRAYLARRGLDADKLQSKVIVKEETVDMGALKALVTDEVLPEDVLALAKPGKFHTPSVSIQNKLETSITDDA